MGHDGFVTPSVGGVDPKKRTNRLKMSKGKVSPEEIGLRPWKPFQKWIETHAVPAMKQALLRNNQDIEMF